MLPLQVSVIGAPTDWVSIIAALFAAFFGAAAAFWFNKAEGRKEERRHKRNLVNNSVYALSVTTGTLINLKSQYLHRHNKEFGQVLEHVKRLSIHDKAAVSNAVKSASAILHSISAQEEFLNDVFWTWQEMEFPYLPEPETLSFTVEETPDLVRLLMTYRSEVRQVSKRIINRNEAHERLSVGLREDQNMGIIGANTLIFWGEMIAARLQILNHVDVALGILPAILAQILLYREKGFKKPRLDKLLRRKEKWVGFSVTEKWKPFLPDSAQYNSIIKGEN